VRGTSSCSEDVAATGYPPSDEGRRISSVGRDRAVTENYVSHWPTCFNHDMHVGWIFFVPYESTLMFADVVPCCLCGKITTDFQMILQQIVVLTICQQQNQIRSNVTLIMVDKPQPSYNLLHVIK